MGTNTTSTSSDVEPAALREAIGLLRSSPCRVDGYIDVLGELDPLSTYRGSRVFRTRFLPRVYERYSRPLASRLFLGMRGPRIAEEREMALEALRIEPGESVLDVGCGPGNCTRWFSEAAGDGLVIGIDPSPTMLSRAVELGGERIAYVRGDGAALPFDDRQFDAVGTFGVLHVMDDPIAALDEMVRVLAPGGRLALAAFWGRRKRRVKGVHVFARDELTGRLADRGMTVTEQRLVGRFQFVAARKREG